MREDGVYWLKVDVTFPKAKNSNIAELQFGAKAAFWMDADELSSKLVSDDLILFKEIKYEAGEKIVVIIPDDDKYRDAIYLAPKDDNYHMVYLINEGITLWVTHIGE